MSVSGKLFGHPFRSTQRKEGRRVGEVSSSLVVPGDEKKGKRGDEGGQDLRCLFIKLWWPGWRERRHSIFESLPFQYQDVGVRLSPLGNHQCLAYVYRWRHHRLFRRYGHLFSNLHIDLSGSGESIILTSWLEDS